MASQASSGDRFRLGQIEVGDVDLRPLFGEELSRDLALAGCAAGDDRDLVGEAE